MSHAFDTWRPSVGKEWLEEASILQLQDAMQTGKVTAEQLVQWYLYRIALWDQRGPSIHSILEVNPDVMHIARAMDHERKSSGPRGHLHGIPVVLKDNVNTADKMHTSGGTLALANAFAKEDAFIVQRLRAAGAVILGKANMTELANFMAKDMPSGYSSRGGQVLNPYGPGVFDVGGSSSGSAAAVAANFTVASVGTETSGSILNPALQNAIVGIKPTVGLLSRTGLMPISFSQDTPGPMARSVTDAAILLGVLTGQDERDAATWSASGKSLQDYTLFLRTDGLQGARVGVYQSGSLSSTERWLYLEAIREIERLGATVIDDVDIPAMDALQDITGLTHEFKPALNAYLRQLTVPSGILELKDIILFNQEHARDALKYGQYYLVASERTSGTLTEPIYLENRIRSTYLSQQQGIDLVMSNHRLDVILFPGDAGSDVAARAGYPSVAVPAGFKPNGEPFGVTFTGNAYSESVLIQYAYAYEQATNHRAKPLLGS